MDNKTFDRSKFKFQEIFNNNNGKTSASGFSAVILILVASFSFLVAMVGYILKFPATLSVMQYITIIIASACALLGVRHVSDSKNGISVDAGKTDDSTEDSNTSK